MIQKMVMIMMNDHFMVCRSQEEIFKVLFVTLDTLSDALKGRVLSLIERPELRQQCLTALIQVMLAGELRPIHPRQLENLIPPHQRGVLPWRGVAGGAGVSVYDLRVGRSSAPDRNGSRCEVQQRYAPSLPPCRTSQVTPFAL